MAWPRIKNPRSSAQPGSPPAGGVHATVTPAPDAAAFPGGGQIPGSGQNTGVTGATHTVAETPGTVRPRRAPWPAPIRYAHSGREATPAAPTMPADALPDAVPPFDTEPEEPADEGIAIFNGLATTEVPVDSTRELPAQPRRLLPGSAVSGVAPPAWRPVEPTRSRRITSPLRAVESGEESQLRSFGTKLNALRSGAAQESDGHQRVAVRDLPPDVQLRFWRLRATLMLVVGVAFWLLTKHWEVGLTLAILAGIADTIYRSRNAANYQLGVSHPGARKRTRRQLAKLRRLGYLALEARPIPGSPEQIDHLVIGPTGVYAIDSEKWDAKVPIRTLSGTKLYHGPQSMKNRLEHAVWEARQASEILSAALGTEIKVQPALAIYGPKIPWDIATIRNVDVFNGQALGKYLKRRHRMRDGVQRLTPDEVRSVYDTAARLLPDAASTRSATPVG